MKTGKYYFLGIALATIAFLYIGYDLYFLAPLRRRKSRNFAVNTNDTLAGANPSPVTPITIGNTPVPIISRSAYDTNQLLAFLPNLQKLRNQFGENIKRAATNANLPQWLLEAFVLVENGQDLDPNYINQFKATGLMQVTEILATDAVILGLKRRIVSEAEKNVIRKVLGTAKAERIFNAKIGVSPIITAKDLTNVDLNFTIACIYINWLMADSQMSNGQWRFDVLIARYNGSWTRWKLGKDLLGKTVQQIYNLVPSETKAYIEKFAGTNSILQLVTRY